MNKILPQVRADRPCDPPQADPGMRGAQPALSGCWGEPAPVASCTGRARGAMWGGTVCRGCRATKQDEKRAQALDHRGMGRLNQGGQRGV